MRNAGSTRLLAIFEAAAVAPIDGQTPEPVVNIVVDQVTFETHLARRRLIPLPADLPTPGGRSAV